MLPTHKLKLYNYCNMYGYYFYSSPFKCKKYHITIIITIAKSGFEESPPLPSHCGVE